MENRKAEFLKTICQIYMVVILAVLPLYDIPGNGYYKLGDSKYYLFRNISLICLGICCIVEVIHAIGTRFAGNKADLRKLLEHWRRQPVTAAVCTYGICALISAACSPYGSTAWLGEREWYLGAVTICLMVGGFLLTANYGGQCRGAALSGEAAFVVVTLLGLLQKLGFDPLGMLHGYVVGDWEYTHMLSTMGNNNWLSGYYSVMFPFSLALFYQAVIERKRYEKLLYGMCNVLAVMLLLLQGSDGGVLVAAMALGVCFFLTQEQGECWEAFLLLFAVAAVGMQIWGKQMKTLGTYDILLQDGIAKKMGAWRGWLPTAVALLLFCGIHHRLSGEKKRILRKMTVYGSLSIVAIALMWYVYYVSGTEFAEWGNRRGMLWQMAWRGFREGNLRQKLLGAGPDCFAKYLGEVLPGGTVLFDKGYFAGSIFTNAHNEWLTTLVNMGIVGTIAYAAVFVSALRKYKGNFLAALMLFTYGVYSMISFQQVLNAPFLFLMLGVCEAGSRAANKTDRSAQISDRPEKESSRGEKEQ